MISDQDDYLRFLGEYGFTEAQARSSTEQTADLLPMDFPTIERRPSPIEGLGMFAKRNIGAGDVIGPARIRGMRTPAGRYTNHSPRPNAMFVVRDGDIYLVAKQPIPVDTEVTIDLRQALEVNGWGRKPISLDGDAIR